MADRSAATITIGGPLPLSRVRDLAAAIDMQGCEIHEPDAVDEPESLAEIAQRGVPIRVIDPEAAGGTMDEVEALCREIGLTYVRTTDARYEDSGEVMWWAPGMAAPGWTEGDQSGDALLPVARVAAVLNEPGEAEARLSALRALLAERTPVTVPPLVLVDETGAPIAGPVTLPEDVGTPAG